ncbi:hypothetical protein VM98_16565 [Streptomyces rubellomurinus subsp. indigoferus]|nr:hypothetical protein VM98_16565 [Streptomyces rubellomurinus subsp. indigoferus]
MLRYHGPWRITVLGKDTDFEQRVLVRGRYGTRVLPGCAGASLVVDEDSWTLALEHLAPGRLWRPNLRTTPGPLTDRDGTPCQVVTSNDCHRSGKPLDYANLVLRLERLDTASDTPDTPAGPARSPVYVSGTDR